jgi:hypothetical protein
MNYRRFRPRRKFSATIALFLILSAKNRDGMDIPP